MRMDYFHETSESIAVVEMYTDSREIIVNEEVTRKFRPSKNTDRF